MDLLVAAARSIQQRRKSQYFSGGALATYIYDYSLTLDREVEFVWKSRWTLIKIVYLVNRYLIVASIIVQQFLLGTTNESWALSCEGLIQVFILLTTFGTLLSELMLCRRLWIMWNHNKIVIVVTIGIFLGITTYYVFESERTFKSNNPDSDLPGIAHFTKGCVLGVQQQHAYITPIILVSSDVAKVILALIPTLRIYESEPIFRSSLMNEVYREGVSFYVYLCVYSGVELALVLRSANNAITAVPVFVVIRVILSSRMVLHTRQLYAHELHLSHIIGSTIRSTYM